MIDEKHVFNNRYRLDSKLGEGGMATVYCGTDTLLRRRVAVKVLREQFASDEEFVRRFYQEAESAAKLSHPNIVNTYDVGREGDTYYIVMELVDGPSLAEIIAADGNLPEYVAIDYAAQTCNGLAYAHRQGLLHRDIKPANILVTKDDVVKLSDFGIARAVAQQTMAMTRPGLVMGSVYYLSPEQAQGRELHETSDLYSVGIVLYQMLTGKLPYAGESPVTVALKHISDPVPRIDGAELGVSPALSAIVNKLLQKNPERRFQSASEVASALREARERPSYAAFPTHDDDSPTQPMRVVPQPPPRPSRLPDRPYTYTSVSDDENRTQRSGGRIILALVAAMIAAAIAGYLAYARPFAPVQRIKINNYVGMTDSQAQRAIVNAGLAAHIARAASATVAPNHVVSQDPSAGSMVAKASTVNLIVSSGKPTVGLRDVQGYTLADAQKDLTSDKFDVRTLRRYDPSDKDSVIGEQPRPGTELPWGSVITLTVSNGPAPIKVPKLEGMKIGAARGLAGRLGFTINVSETAPMDGVPADTIASQDPPSGTVIPADHSTSVNVVVSTGGPLAPVPSAVTHSLADAQQALKQAGFKTAISYQIKLASPDNGTVIDQNPRPGTNAQKGTTVTLILSVPGEVPDVGGMALDQAKSVLTEDGYQVGNVTPTTEGASGNVVRTEPEVGTQLRPGSPVNIFINSASAQPALPLR